MAPIGRPGPPYRLIRFLTLLLAQSLTRKGFFSTTLLAWFHVEAVLLDFLDDVFLLHFALETAQSVLQGFAFLDDDFSHVKFTPNPVRIGNLRCRFLRCTAREHYRMQSATCARARGQDYGASCSQFGYQVSSDSYEKGATEREK